MSVDARDLDGCNDATRVGLNALNRARAPRARDARRATREESRTRSFLSRAKKRNPRRGTRERARTGSPPLSGLSMLTSNIARRRARVAEDAGGRRRRRDRAMGDGARAKLDAKRARGGADGR